MDAKRLSEPVMRAVLDTAVSPYLLVDAAGEIEWASASVEELLGYQAAELVGQNIGLLFDRDERRRAAAAFVAMADESTRPQWGSAGLVYSMRAADGREVPCDIGAATPARTGIGGFVVQLRRAGGAAALQRTIIAMASGASIEEVLGTICELAEANLGETRVEVMHGWTGDGFTEVVPACGSVVGADQDEPGRRPWFEAALEGQTNTLTDLSELPPSVRTAAEQVGADTLLVHPVSIASLRRPGCVLLAWRGEDAPKAAREEHLERVCDLLALAINWSEGRRALEWEARHDPLTRLANRRGLELRLAAGLSGAVIYLDLDDFKAVNDLHGHVVGDWVLSILAERLKTSMRPDDLVARLGGDEFAVFCPGVERLDQAVELARRAISRMCEPVQAGDVTLSVGASAGVAIHDGQHAPDVVLAVADTHLMDAKAAGRRQVRPLA